MCLDFWQQNGAIEITDEVVSDEKLKEASGNAKCCVCEEEKSSVECEKSTKITVKSLPVKKPTQREIAKRLSEAEDKAEMLKQIGKEMDDELEEQIKQLNKSVNGNLKVALTATGLLLFFAVILILIERFL